MSNKISNPPKQKGGLPFKILLDIAAKNLLFKRFRSFITVLGVVVGVSSVFLLLSLGLGLQKLVEHEIIGSSSINVIDVSTANSKLITLSDSVVDKMKNLPGVSDVSTVNSQAGKISIKKAVADVVVYGIDKDYLSISSANISNGTNLDPEKQDELIINKAMLETVGYKDINKALGESVSISFKLPDDSIVDKMFKIKGVVDDTTDSEVFVSKHIFPGLKQEVYSQAKVVAKNRQDIARLRSQIESTGFTTSSPVDTLDEVTKVFRIFNLILVAFSSIGMFIAVLGMLNTLTVSLLERTREIALMVTLGARPKDIRRLFNLEAVILSLVGGVAGIILASGTGLLLNVVVNALAHDRGVAKNVSLFAVPILLVFGTLTAISLIGLAVSYFPAKRAARLNPIEALRIE